MNWDRDADLAGGPFPKCYFSKCGTYAEMTFTDKYGAREIWTTVVSPWAKVTSMAEGVGPDCAYVGSHEPAHVSNEADVEECTYVGLKEGADTFGMNWDRDADLAGGPFPKCYFSKCGTYAEMTFTDKYGAREIWTTVVSPWAKVTSMAEGVGPDCSYVGSHEPAHVSNAADIEECTYVGAKEGADTFGMNW